MAGAALADGLPDLWRNSGGSSRGLSAYCRTEIARGKEIVLADLTGPGKVTYFYMSNQKSGRLYPGLVLKVLWDDETEPSILVPLSDFFGAIGGIPDDYQSEPMQVNHHCLMCYLPMPFSKRARFVLANDSPRDYAEVLAYGLDYEKNDSFAQEKSRLHCCWRRSNPTENSMHTLLDVTGRGHYVGNFLQVVTRDDAWWGEGDTIFHVDSETITHSPGTEDEYGACYGFGHSYSYLYSGYWLTRKKENRMYRWYVANPVRFQKALKVEIQNQRAEGDKQVPSRDDYVSVAFWYQDEPHQQFFLQPYAERTARTKATAYTPAQPPQR